MPDPSDNVPESSSPKEQRQLAKDAVKAAERAQKARVKEAKATLDAARKRHGEKVQAAERSLKAVRKTAKEQLEAGRRRLERAQEGEAIAACAPFTLFPDRVHTPDGTVALEPEMQASVDTSGGVSVDHRPTATRCCLCGCLPAFFLQKKEVTDTRQMFISVTGRGFSSVAAVPPRMEETARAFVAALNAAAPSGPSARAAHEEEIAAAKREFQELEAQTTTDESSAVDEVEQAKADSSEIEAAERALSQAEANTGEIEAARERLRQLEAGDS